MNTYVVHIAMIIISYLFIYLFCVIVVVELLFLVVLIKKPSEKDKLCTMSEYASNLKNGK